MAEPTLVVLAAGLSSRYGSLKQIDPVGRHGEIIIDYSIYDAVRAGFKRVVFLIAPWMHRDFEEAIGRRVSRSIETVYAFQTHERFLPEGFAIPPERKKPWGTAHALLCCREVLDGPFAMINADDYYGVRAFQMAYDFLTDPKAEDAAGRYMMVGYRLENTLTENGYVSRGVCVTDDEGYLRGINERTHIEKRGDGAAYTEDEGASWTELPADAAVSMNMWGFSADILEELKKRFVVFLEENLEKNPLKCEFFLPFVVDELLEEKKATVKVLKSADKWYGVTYKEDKPMVMAAVQNLKDQGLYPQKLWQ